jgi:hypothetical protein
MRVVCCLALVTVVGTGSQTGAPMLRANPPAAAERSFVLWDIAVEKSVRGQAFAFRHRLVEQQGRFYLEWEYQGERQRVELTNLAGPTAASAGVLKARVSEVRVAPGERVSARLTVEAHVHGTSFTLLDQTNAANYGLGIVVSGGRVVPGFDSENHNR